MYSPKIPERLVPVLYRLARARGQHMTTLVAELLDAQLTLLPPQETGPAPSYVGTAPREPVKPHPRRGRG